MTHMLKFLMLSVLCGAALTACERQSDQQADTPATTAVEPAAPAGEAVDVLVETNTGPRLDIYTPVVLTADLSGLSEAQKDMVGLLIEAAQLTDDIFWQQVWGDRDALLDAIDDPAVRRFAEINYGPWDRLDADAPFIEAYGPRPPGANFYPQDMTREEFEAWDQPGKDGEYSLVRRDEAGALVLVPYSEAYEEELLAIALLLRQAADLAEDPGFETYLRLRADALLSDDYQPSDLAWMDTKTNAGGTGDRTHRNLPGCAVRLPGGF